MRAPPSTRKFTICACAIITNVNAKSIEIKGKNYKLLGTLIYPTNALKKSPAVIFYHGMVSQSKPRYVKRAEELAKNGIIGLTFDFRGCGESKDAKMGQLTLSDWFSDALLAFDFLAKQPNVDINRIGVSGKSFGGYMTALVSEIRKVKSIVLQAPAVYPDTWFRKPYLPTDEYQDKRFNYRISKNALKNKAIKNITKYTNPLLIIGSELDDTCPEKIVKGYYDSCPSKNKKLVWIKGADHPLTKDVWNQQYIKLMTDWFTKTL